MAIPAIHSPSNSTGFRLCPVSTIPLLNRRRVGWGDVSCTPAVGGVAFNSSSSWSLFNFGGSSEDHLAGFARWGKGYDDANVDMSPNSFYLALSDTDRLETNLDAFTLAGSGLAKVATYQVLCRVKGKMRFALVKSDDASVVFDEVILDSQSDYSDLTLVTLRGQYGADGGWPG